LGKNNTRYFKDKTSAKHCNCIIDETMARGKENGEESSLLIFIEPLKCSPNLGIYVSRIAVLRHLLYLVVQAPAEPVHDEARVDVPSGHQLGGDKILVVRVNLHPVVALHQDWRTEFA
jgi:hypothetical protein